MEWAMVIQNQWMAALKGSQSALTVAEEVAQFVGYMRDPRYLRTPAAHGGRPVVYIFNCAAFGSAAAPAGADSRGP